MIEFIIGTLVFLFVIRILFGIWCGLVVLWVCIRGK